ncbi:periplasmic heavy metal sensor [Limibaculum sp. M0105]|uniref:Periplasmic heavy metal sensor n=1 Tax=Thermohalobaculum xanthum TaxID=2753746 RepID=A0A8J7SI24_9RHOB|nr:periplasmic heavy metal sensor [Thermohalobaculum xanthum]MBK0401127.1 periplasmic heavy metal sensor [Thermohalobaculum xanthum]
MSAEAIDAGAGTPGGCPRWMRLLLVASLSGNLAVVGLVGGWMMRKDHWHGHDAEGLDPRQARLLHLLPEARQDEARALMLAESAGIAAERAQMTQAQGEIVAVLRSPDFTPERLGDALDRRSAFSGAVNGLIHAQIVTIASRMSPDERAEMADRIEEATRRWAKRRGHR